MRGISVQEFFVLKSNEIDFIINQVGLSTNLDLYNMIETMKDALGDDGIYVTSKQLNFFKTTWESHFGHSHALKHS